MIRTYCQFSFGGFKTFKIKGERSEPLDHEVTSENRLDFPELCEFYFNRGGVKILYRFIDKKNIALIVSEIPGPTKDSDGITPINTAVQFVGDREDDREVLDKLCICIIQNLPEFEKDYADMFSTRGGLHFDGDRLNNWIQKAASGIPRLNNVADSIKGHSREILLFIPSNGSFGKSDEVTQNVLSELKFDGALNYIPFDSLMRYCEKKDESSIKVLSYPPKKKLKKCTRMVIAFSALIGLIFLMKYCSS